MMTTGRLSLLSAMVLAFVPRASHAGPPGWSRIDLGGGAYAMRYLPHSVRPCDPLPLALFLHGAGGTPEGYESYVESAAESNGLVLVLPAASGMGWADADTPHISAALDAVSAELNIDGTRTYFSGHSAGAAFAYLLAYESSTGVAAVFTLSAPYYQVTTLAEPTYRAPIHMYFGDTDPNYTGGGEMALVQQWNTLGIPHEQDIEAGFGHSNWPPTTIPSGFAFLLTHHYPGAPPASTCGGAIDGSVTAYDAGSRAADAGITTGDSGVTDGGGVVSGCGCAIGGAERSLTAFHFMLAALGISLIRRRRRI